MDFERKKHPIVNVSGAIEAGTQFDLEVVLPKDDRDAIFGVIKDFYREPICDAVVKLVEIEFCDGKKIRKPVSHTFTDQDGAFVFGPLCPDRKYEILVWANKVNNVKLCAKCNREMDCLKGTCMDKCDFDIECNSGCHKDKDDNGCECNKD